MREAEPLEKKKITNYLANISTLTGLAAVLLFVIWGYRAGIFSSVAAFQQFFKRFGIWAALIFVLIQIIQVVLPILPGAIGCIAGIVIFGPWLGLLYNYIGICIGSILAFLLSKRYGRPLVKGIIGEKSYQKYIGWINRGKKFDSMFAMAIFFPIAPDDLLCYIAGLSEMKLMRFVTIILLGKPLSIAAYSLTMTAVGHNLLLLFK